MRLAYICSGQHPLCKGAVAQGCTGILPQVVLRTQALERCQVCPEGEEGFLPVLKPLVCASSECVIH